MKGKLKRHRWNESVCFIHQFRVPTFTRWFLAQNSNFQRTKAPLGSTIHTERHQYYWVKALWADSSSLPSLQYLKFSEVIWFLRRNSCKIIIQLWHFPYKKQNFLRKLFLVIVFSPIDSKLSNPYTKHVYLNIMFFNIS